MPMRVAGTGSYCDGHLHQNYLKWEMLLPEDVIVLGRPKKRKKEVCIVKLAPFIIIKKSGPEKFGNLSKTHSK